jgi:hypothetical protein
MVEAFERTPLRSILYDLTAETNQRGLDPFESYELLCRKLNAAGLWFDTYCSSSITSGGHARNSSLDIAQVIQKNTDSAFDVADELYRVGQLDPMMVIEAVAVGKIKHWSQSDYMTFWLCVMARLPLTGAGGAKRMDSGRSDFNSRLEQAGIDMARYNNPTLPASERVLQYMQHADIFASFAQDNDASPIKRLVRLIDTDESLGAQTENYFARVMGSCVMKAAVARVGGDTLPKTYPAKRIVRDTQSIVSFGGHVFDPTRRMQLVLVPDDV